MAPDRNLARRAVGGVLDRPAAAAREPRAAPSGAQSLKVMCAWHPRFFGEELVMREAAPGAGVSHGICERCMDKVFAAEGIAK